MATDSIHYLESEMAFIEDQKLPSWFPPVKFYFGLPRYALYRYAVFSRLRARVPVCRCLGGLIFFHGLVAIITSVT